jgi:hypothetical protein
VTEPKNPGAIEQTEPLPLPGLEPAAPGLSPIERAARRTLSALKAVDLVDERHALPMQLILDLSTVVGAACRKGQAAAAAMATAQILAALATLMPEAEGGEGDGYDQLAADLRSAALDSARRAAEVRDST